MGLLEVHVPVAEPRVDAAPLAARPATLDGCRIGWLDNRKANAGALLDALARHLGGAATAVRQTKDATAAAPDVVMAHLKSCHAVVLAIAD